MEAINFEQFQAFATSLAIGLLIGLERERRTDPKAGVRTFALVGLFGALSGLIAEAAGSGWVLAAGLAVIGAMMVAANVSDPHDDGDPGTTSVVALMVCYGLGAAVWYGYASLAVMAAIGVTALLYFKTELHGFSSQLTHKDLISILQFAVLSFVVLPILPNQDMGPYGALNPHQVWWMVVLISGVSLAGYTALRLVGATHGIAMVGFFGGLVSSTATTLVFARHARDDAQVARAASAVILLANLMVPVRLAIVSMVLAPSLAPILLPTLGAALAAGGLVAAATWRRGSGSGGRLIPEIHNPTELRTAFSFGALYALVLLLAAWLQDLAGSKGLYLVALASGLTDVDAITLSSLRLFSLNQLDGAVAAVAIGLALLSNVVFKSGLVIAIGGRNLARLALPGLAAIAVGLSIALLVLK